MTKSTRNPKVDVFLNEATQWREEYEKLRSIVLDCGLSEELKWGHPVYTFQNKNVVIIHGFKEYCAILFTKGVLLKDAKHILIQQTANVQAGRQVRFTNVREIVKLESTLKAYLKEAIALEKSGAQVKYKKTSDFPVAEELRNKFAKMPALKTAFEALTPGRQRAYLLYFSAAKQSQTREARIEKCLPRIFEGMGLNDD